MQVECTNPARAFRCHARAVPTDCQCGNDQRGEDPMGQNDRPLVPWRRLFHNMSPLWFVQISVVPSFPNWLSASHWTSASTLLNTKCPNNLAGETDAPTLFYPNPTLTATGYMAKKLFVINRLQSHIHVSSCCQSQVLPRGDEAGDAGCRRDET